MIDRASFEVYVQDALDHLYDPAYLLAQPLTALLVDPTGSEPPPHALHRVLREAINALKPPADAPLHSPAWRLYRYLSLRYVEVLTIGQVASELGISPRQCRRDHHDALRAVSAILWDEYLRASRSRGSAPAGPSDADRGALEAELGKMAAAPLASSRVDQVVQGVVTTLAALAAGKHAQLRVAVPVDLPAVALDRTVLRQILLELMLDAIDRGADGEVELSAIRDGEQVRLAIVVRTASAATTTRGLDRSLEERRLAISQRLADLQGAALELTPRADGIAARLSLPTAEAPVVLVVDDNADVVRLFRQYLRQLCEVHAATSGEEALRLAQQLRPAVITLDVMMPAQDGWEVLQTLKHDPATADVPVIVCSVLRERELALSLGAADFLAKPITATDLVGAVHRTVAALAGRRG